MMRRFVSTHVGPALAAAALALVPATQAQQNPGGRAGGGMPFGGGRYGPFPGGQYGGYYPGGQYGGYQSGYGSRYPGNYGGYSGGYYQPPGYGYPGAYNPYQPSAVPQYGYGQPYAVPPTGSAPQYPAAQPSGVSQSAYPPSGNTARLTVRLPADAQLWVDDYQTRKTGTVRVLTTPALQPGQTYHYTLKARWDDNGRPVTQERTVDFQAGGDATVDFTQPTPPAAPQTAPEPVAPPVAKPAVPPPPAAPPG
jgi:uncharacterized protein (TIGR03000 family)